MTSSEKFDRMIDDIARENEAEMETEIITGFFKIGCRKCGDGNGWQMFTDGKGKFMSLHTCGHMVDVKVENLVEEPDKVKA